MFILFLYIYLAHATVHFTFTGVPVTNTFDTTFWIIYRRSLTNLNRNVELPVVIDTTQTAWHEKRVVV